MIYGKVRENTRKEGGRRENRRGDMMKVDECSDEKKENG